MSRFPFASSLLTAAVALPMLAGSPTPKTESLNKAFAEAMVKGDIPTLAKLYTEDGQLLFFKGSTFKGREAITGFMTAFLKDNQVKAMTITSEETHAMGAYLLDTGHYEMTTVSGGKEESSKGRYLQVLAKGKDGKWRLFRDCPLPD